MLDRLPDCLVPPAILLVPVIRLVGSLRKESANTEDRIQAARRLYNADIT